MSLFKEPGLAEKIEGLRTDLGKVLAELKGKKNVSALTDEVAALKEQIADLEINKSKLTEAHEREVRETKHYVGLEKKRQEVELAQAKREATLSVREENLAADKKRFDDHVKFVEDRMNAHLGDIKDLLSKVMERIPTVTVDLGNGSALNRD